MDKQVDQETGVISAPLAYTERKVPVETIWEGFALVVFIIDMVIVLVLLLTLFVAWPLTLYTQDDDCGWDTPYTVRWTRVNGTLYHTREYHPITNPPFKCEIFETLGTILFRLFIYGSLANIPFWFIMGCLFPRSKK